MAGDWIKMGTGLATHPKVIRMASALNADERPDRLRVIGGLHAVWCLFDAHSEDGKLVGYDPAVVDELIGWQGFSAAMIKVEWMAVDGESLVLPEFDTHNGASAKRRAMEADRKRAVRKASASDADKKRTRGEENREDIKTIPVVPSKPKKAAKPKAESKPKSDGVKRTIAAWLETLGKDKPIPPGDAVFAYAEQAGLPPDYLKLAWVEFRQYHIDRPDKKQIDWRATFRNYVRQNYLSLWQPSAMGGYELTKKGVQAQRAMEGTDGQA